MHQDAPINAQKVHAPTCIICTTTAATMKGAYFNELSLDVVKGLVALEGDVEVNGQGRRGGVLNPHGKPEHWTKTLHLRTLQTRNT